LAAVPYLLRLIRKARGAAAEHRAAIAEVRRQLAADRRRAESRANLGGLSNSEIDRLR
jgi:hypothetical protein